MAASIRGRCEVCFEQFCWVNSILVAGVCSETAAYAAAMLSSVYRLYRCRWLFCVGCAFGVVVVYGMHMAL